MTAIQPELLKILACPDCKSSLQIVETEFHCTECQQKFQIQNGIPLLYPQDLDISHLREETLLAEMMKQSQTGNRAEFNAAQWAKAKQEFWNMVHATIGAPPQTILYIGCGYDPGFQSFQKKGHLFINLDLIADMLETLKEKHGAEACIAGDMNALPFQKKSLDAIVIIDVLHHETDQLKPILQGLMDLLKPGGYLFLEDINAWGLFQFGKSILMPKSVYQWARKFYHRFKHAHYAPAEYEFPTSYWMIKRLLKDLGFSPIQACPTNAYPYLNRFNYRIYQMFSIFKVVQQYFNYHYMLSAQKKHEASPELSKNKSDFQQMLESVEDKLSP
ncbi:methyltransferase domain-containing protein [bacterium]